MYALPFPLLYLLTRNTVFSGGFYTGSSQATMCFMYQIATEDIPSSLTTLDDVALSTLEWAASKLNPIYKNNGYPCPLNYDNA